MKKNLLLAGLLAFAGSAVAQQRLVLLEHFTQASCGPCATQNPALKVTLDANPDKIVAIKYQTSWPGVDPMNAANPTDVAARVQYYTVSGVPNSVMDGNFYKGAPSGVTQSRINTRSGVASPVNVDVKWNIIDNEAPVRDSMVVTAKVKAVGNLAAGQVLQMVCIERQIEFATPPGSNGEKLFESVMKKMLPSPNGTPLPAMQAGDSVEFSYKWSITKANGTSEYYNVGRAAAVAFVQNNATKEVLGAGYDAPRPWLAVTKLAGAKNTKIKAGDESTYGFRMSSKTPQDQIIKVKGVVTGLPAGWSFQIIDNGTIYGDTASIALAGNTDKDIEVKIIGPNDGQLNKKITARVEVNSATIFPDVKATQTFVAITPSNILFIDHGGTAVSRFTQAFNAASQTFVGLNAEEAGDLSSEGLEFSNIKKIFYSTGASFAGTMNATKAEAFSNYLNSGGNLFAIGQDIGYEVAVSQDQDAMAFMNNYLGADYLGDGTTATITVSAVADETMLAPYFTTTLSLSGTNSYPDQLEPYIDAPNAVGFLQYSNDNMAAIYNSGSDADTWKTVFVGFRIEAFGTSAAHIAFRNNLVGKSNAWFDNTLTSNELAQSMRTFRPAYPNPARQNLNVSISGAQGEVVINDITGKLILKQEVMANTEGWANLNVSGLKPGVYFLQTISNGVSAPVQKITIE